MEAIGDLVKVVKRLMTLVEGLMKTSNDCVRQVNRLTDRLDGRAPADDRRTEAPGPGLRSARSHLLRVK